MNSPTILAAIALFALVPNLALADSSEKLTEDEAAKLAAEAYVYGYPLVLMDVSRQVMTAVAKPTTTAAPINQFNVSRSFRTPLSPTWSARTPTPCTRLPGSTWRRNRSS